MSPSWLFPGISSGNCIYFIANFHLIHCRTRQICFYFVVRNQLPCNPREKTWWGAFLWQWWDGQRKTKSALRSGGLSGYVEFQEFCWQKLFCFSQSLKQLTYALYSLFLLEEVQGLITKDFSLVRRGLAPGLPSHPFQIPQESCSHTFYLHL